MILVFSLYLINNILELLFKLDGIGPVDNRPSNDKLYNCVKNIAI